MAAVGTTGSAFTTVRLQTPASCPSSLWVRTGHSATPRGRPLAAKWPWLRVRGSTRPGARRCRRCRGAAAKQASGSDAVADSPDSSANLSAARLHRRSGPPAGQLPASRLHAHVRAGWQGRRTQAPRRQDRSTSIPLRLITSPVSPDRTPTRCLRFGRLDRPAKLGTAPPKVPVVDGASPADGAAT